MWGMSVKKEEYGMHDGLPIWKHLMDNGHEHRTKLKGGDYGKLAERIGKREIRELIKFKNFIAGIFPDIVSLSFSRKSKWRNRGLEYGDYCLEINYQKKDGTGYGKKVLIIEIKHGKIHIPQQQIRRYCEYIINPAAYFRKADEVKIIFMLFTEIDTASASATYSLCEFNPDLASRIINAVPKRYELDRTADVFAFMDFKGRNTL